LCASKAPWRRLVVRVLAQRLERLHRLDADTMRSRFFTLISLMPGISLSSERVPMRPITQGIWIAEVVLHLGFVGPAIRLKPAGAGSVSHMASIAASLVCWASPTV
jgi:hypothetical protein